MPAIFFSRYRVNGKLTRKKIGEYPDISINEARILALECYDYFKHAQLPTFKEAKELFIKKKTTRKSSLQVYYQYQKSPFSYVNAGFISY